MFFFVCFVFLKKKFFLDGETYSVLQSSLAFTYRYKIFRISTSLLWPQGVYNSIEILFCSLPVEGV